MDAYLAGVCDGIPGAGGWGAVLRYGTHERELHGGESAPTTVRLMVGTAAIEALERLTRPVAVRLHAASTTASTDLVDTAFQQRLNTASQPHRVEWVSVAAEGSTPMIARAKVLARQGMLSVIRHSDTRCVHDLILDQCWRCRPRPTGFPARVAITSGGAVFHLSEGCRALHEAGGRSNDAAGLGAT
ncbi:hypothetical protein [Dactylosporangium sp. NPDC051541]|uniref:hypothetical protein n=1 Tax=Dactylosporangium sp. NPDC051541 TaxID=3363977 RepID=UPI0037B0430E